MILPTLAVVFAAFCVWLTVRIINRRERWAKRTAVSMVLLLVGNPLSIRPAFWLTEMEVVHFNSFAHAYYPWFVLLSETPTPIKRLAIWYAGEDKFGAEVVYRLGARIAYEEQMGFGVP